MKYIKKQKEPESLVSHRCKLHATYDNYREKDDLRISLLNEQGYICCYCMQHIGKHNMKIEHLRPRSKFEQDQLDYDNLLGACSGNEGFPKHLHHCDTKKGKVSIKINPTDKNCETFVKFKSSGEIYSDNEDINKDIDDTLNLNMYELVKTRKAVLDQALKKFKHKHRGKWTKSIIEKEIDKWSARGRYDKYKRYCRIVVFYFEKKLRKSMV